MVFLCAGIPGTPAAALPPHGLFIMHRQEEGRPKGAAAAGNAAPEVTCAVGV